MYVHILTLAQAHGLLEQIISSQQDTHLRSQDLCTHVYYSKAGHASDITVHLRSIHTHTYLRCICACLRNICMYMLTIAKLGVPPTFALATTIPDSLSAPAGTTAPSCVCGWYNEHTYTHMYGTHTHTHTHTHTNAHTYKQVYHCLTTTFSPSLINTHIHSLTHTHTNTHTSRFTTASPRPSRLL